MDKEEITTWHEKKKKKKEKHCEKHDHQYKIWQNKSWNEALLFIYPSPWTTFVITAELLKVLR